MTIHRAPWERRLEDLGHTFVSCSSTYFDPDLFRRNVNHFLQTARTVTFIIQKHKSEIVDFNVWYEQNVLKPWKDDKIMSWAKDARNEIEKEGDLELHSTLDVAILFSYLAENDHHLHCGHTELLKSSVDRLMKSATQKMPSGIKDASALKIERSWITSKLPDVELLQALAYVYSTLYACVVSLASHLGRDVPESILSPGNIIPIKTASRRIKYIKLKDGKQYNISTEMVNAVPIDEFPSDLKGPAVALKSKVYKPDSFRGAMDLYQMTAKSTFEQFGNHLPMIFLLNSEWNLVDLIAFAPQDQTDKYFFWRSIGDRIELQHIHALIFISETWIRDIKGYPNAAMSDLPIIGEKLQVSGIDRDKNNSIRSWNINRAEGGEVHLGPCEELNLDDLQLFHLVPVMRSMGYEPPFMRKLTGTDC